jgi:hypothetical protein
MEDDVGNGLLHALDRDGSALCGCPYGLLTSSSARCTCMSCLSIWEEAKHQHVGRPLVTDDADEIGH